MLVHGEPAVARGRICVTSRRGRDGLSFTPLIADGTARATRRLPSRVTRPAPNVLEAVFLPAAAGLPLGAYSWSATAAWSDDGQCARTCDDRFPRAAPRQPACRGFRRARSGDCLRWNQEMLAWLLSHPEVGTVFLSAHIGATVVPQRGQSVAAATRSGYRDLIGTLLTAGRRVVVVRDTPTPAPRHLDCIAKALRAGRPPGTACARPRRTALRPDPLVAAARAVRSPLVEVVDLTRQVCDKRRCLAVVGGALVNRNGSHLSPLFAATLGPFLLRAVGDA